MEQKPHRKFVVFENDGTLDPRAITTFGVSVKETQNPIGYFGTGMKYAIAIFLRHNCFVGVITGEDHLNFEKKTVQVRGQPFEIITMNNAEMPFTTRLGVNWELWQAFREIYCNCIDEGGEVYLADELPEAQEGKTFFVIGGPTIELIYHERHKIVLQLPEKQRIADGRVEIFNVPSSHLYYRGIRVLDLPKQSMFTYNIIEQQDLTEDRTLKHPSWAMQELPKAIARLTDKPTIRRVLTAKDTAEEDFSYSDFQYHDSFVTDEFAVVLAEEFNFNNDKLNRSATEYHRKRMNRQASKHYEPEDLSPVEKQQLARAIEICTRVYPDFKDYRVMTVKTLGQETMALADMSERAIVLSKASYKMGTKYLVSTLIEEYTHIKTGYHDCSRNLQTHLFDTITTMIEEHVLGEPI